MSQKNTNTNTGTSNTNRNQNTNSSGRGQGDSGGKGRGGPGGDHRKNSIAKYLFEGKMKDGCLFKLTITKTGRQATQYKMIIDALPIFYEDKNYRYIDDIICTGTKLLEVAFLPTYLDTTQ